MELRECPLENRAGIFKKKNRFLRFQEKVIAPVPVISRGNTAPVIEI